jgi:hypothetical protein
VHEDGTQTVSLIREAIEALARQEMTPALRLVEEALASLREDLTNGWRGAAGLDGEDAISTVDLLNCASCLIAARNALSGDEAQTAAHTNLSFALCHFESGVHPVAQGRVTVHQPQP